MIQERKALVQNENILGVRIGNMVQVLHASVLRGASSPHLYLVAFDENSSRPAAQEDFDAFRVKSHPDYFA